MKKFLLIFTTLISILISCCDSGSSSSKKNPVDPYNPEKPAKKTLVVFDNTYGVCTALVYDDYRRRGEDKIAEVPAGQRSPEIECYAGDRVPFYFAYIISLNGFNDFTVNYVPKNGKDQKAVDVAANTKTTVNIPRLDETFSSADQLLSPRSFLLLRNESAYSFELHRGRSSIKPDNVSTSPVLNSGERAFYTIDSGVAANYRLLAGIDYIEFPDTPDRFEAGHFYGYTYNGEIFMDNEIPVNLDNIVLKTYTVTFNANGADGTAPVSQTANAGSAVTLPGGGGLTKSGYTFCGWNAADTGAEINYSADASYTVTGNITLYATWRPLGTVMYTVTFDGNGGSASAGQNIVSGKTVFRPVDPFRIGHIFVGWYGNAALTSEYNFSKPVTEAFTIYAKWEAIRYTVTFNANGASGVVPAAQTANAGSAITLPNGNGLSKKGYVFSGWSVNDSGMEAAYNAGASYVLDGDITLFAKWDILPCTVTFHSNGGSAVPSQGVPFGSVVTCPEEPVRNGYMFIGWYGDSKLTEEYNFLKPVSYNVVLYARWVSVVNGIRLNKSTMIMDIGETETLTASVSTGNTLIETLTWNSSNTAVATVNQNGTVTAVRGGTATITITIDGNKTDTCAVTVYHYTGTDIATFKTWLESQPYGSTYNVKLSVNSLGGSYNTDGSLGNLLYNDSKRVNLDLSGSTFTSFGTSPFYECTYLTGVTIPNSVTSIDGRAFIGCSGLTSVTIPSSVTSIGSMAFYRCTGLPGITIPDSVTSIGDYAFLNCYSLTGVTIPDSVTRMGQEAFRSCNSLTIVTFATESNISSDNFGASAFPEGGDYGGNTLRTAYLSTSGGAGTYTREPNGDTWTKQP